MTVRVSRLPSVQSEKRQEERKKWVDENRKELMAVLLQENKERMLDIYNKYLKDRDINKYIERQNKQQIFFIRRLFVVLGK